MATSKIAVTEGSGKNLATHSFSEDAVTKELSRVVPSTSAGTEILPATSTKQSDGTQKTQLVDGSGNVIGATSNALNVNTNALADTLDSIKAADSTDVLMNGLVELTPLFAVINASSSGNNTLVAAVTAKKIRVLAYNFIANGTVNAKFQSGASGTDLTGLKYCVVNTGIVAPYNPKGWFETAAATLLNLNLSGAIAVGGELVYVTI